METRQLSGVQPVCNLEQSARTVPLTCPNSRVSVWTKRSCGLSRYRCPVREIEVRRSARRKRSIQVRREGNKTIALVPAHVSQAEADAVIARLIERLDRRELRTKVSDEDLIARATALSAQYFGGKAVPSSVRWVSNQNSRWGSCTTTDGSIRLSDRLIGMPLWVVDYVLVHELAHLIEANHGPEFWALVEAYPKTERAKGFLEGVAHQQP